MPSSSSSSSSSNQEENRTNQENVQGKNDRAPVKTFNRVDQVPIPYEQRTCTDIFCTIVGVLFSLIMFILAMVVYDHQTFTKSNFPTDSDGKLCGVDYPSYPYLYFANPPNIARRVCVSKCPQLGAKQLNCRMTEEIGCRFSNATGFEVVLYDSQHALDRIGMFCLPDDQKLRNQILVNAKLQGKYVFINSIDAIVVSFFVGLAISIIYCILTQFFPRVMNKVAVIGGPIIIAIFVILLLVYSSKAPFKILVATILAVIFVILVLNYIKNRKMFDLQGIFLEAATKMLRAKPATFAYIPLFLALLVIFSFLLILQFKSFWAGGSVSFDAQKSIFYIFSSSGPVIGTVFILIQAIWGLSFLKQAFNFCVSGNAVSYYYGNDWNCASPLKFMVLKHFGSIIGGSFMTGFFTFGDYIFDLLKPKSVTEDQTPGCYTKFFNSCFCKFFSKIFDLVRSDAMAYINLTGNPYCNSARYCEYLCDKSRILQFSQSSSRTYRISAHLLIAGIIGVAALYMKGQIAPFAVLIVMVLIIFQCTFFVSIHADASQAILILFLEQQQFGKRQYEKNNKGFNRERFEDMQGMQFKQEQLKKQIFEVTKSHLG